MSTFTDLKDRLVSCGFSSQLLDQLLEESKSLPAVPQEFRSFVARALERDSVIAGQPAAGEEIHIVTISRSWRPKEEVIQLMLDDLEVDRAEFAEIRLKWVLRHEGRRLANPDKLLIAQAMRDSAYVDPVVDPLAFVLEKDSVPSAWWDEVVDIGQPWTDEVPDSLSPIVSEISSQVSLNSRIFNLRDYTPHKRTVSWLFQRRLIPKAFIFDRVLVIEPFVAHMNQLWLNSGVVGLDRWRFIENEFCRWVIQHHRKYCALNKEAAFEFAVTRYAKQRKLSGDALHAELKTIAAGADLERAISLIEAKLH